MSDDDGDSFSQFTYDDTLIEPICQAGLVSLPDENAILFANPASVERRNMTVRLSRDDGRTWPVAKVIHAGPAAYSDLAICANGEIVCLYERGEEGPYEMLMLARFGVRWMEG